MLFPGWQQQTSSTDGGYTVLGVGAAVDAWHLCLCIASLVDIEAGPPWVVWLPSSWDHLFSLVARASHWISGCSGRVELALGIVSFYYANPAQPATSILLLANSLFKRDSWWCWLCHWSLKAPGIYFLPTFWFGSGKSFSVAFIYYWQSKPAQLDVNHCWSDWVINDTDCLRHRAAIILGNQWLVSPLARGIFRALEG